MNFTNRDLDMIISLATTKHIVRVTGANYVGQPFETFGVVLCERDASGACRQTSRRQFILYVGQTNQMTKRRQYVSVFTDFDSARCLCVDKIYDMEDRLVYENPNFAEMNEDNKWQVNKFFGVDEIRIEDIRGKLSKLIGKPIIVNGERLVLLAVGRADRDGEEVCITCSTGSQFKVLNVKDFMVELDREARGQLNKVANIGSNPGELE